ncbi:MAG: NAD-dependent epimerase/dehydratase family protein [Ruminococcaceae bacterium]|nr:NAD-dependent epimerase/dehydratase family protein [Oscillospiraceae bacterium]
MKRVLITGANSYVGTSFEKYISENFADDYTVDTVDTVDTIDGSWREKDFSEYDVVFHVAGIAHSDNRKNSEKEKNLYYAINTVLTEEVAKKAKESGVKQFVFTSSAIVYGDSSHIGQSKIITPETPVSPSNCYGNSKVQAEKRLEELKSEDFKIVILRSPMIYGKNSKGNYPLLSKMASKLPFFPFIENQRSMLYIENLCEFVRLMIKNEEQGIFWPQNEVYSNTSEMVKAIADVRGKNLKLIKGFTWLIKLAGLFTGLVDKAFGNLTYDKAMSDYKEEYRIVKFDESIRKTEAE